MSEKNALQNLTASDLDQVSGGYVEYVPYHPHFTQFVFTAAEAEFLKEKRGISLEPCRLYGILELNRLGISGSTFEEINAVLTRLGLKKDMRTEKHFCSLG